MPFTTTSIKLYSRKRQYCTNQKNQISSLFFKSNELTTPFICEKLDSLNWLLLIFIYMNFSSSFYNFTLLEHYYGFMTKIDCLKSTMSLFFLDTGIRKPAADTSHFILCNIATQLFLCPSKYAYFLLISDHRSSMARTCPF